MFRHFLFGKEACLMQSKIRIITPYFVYENTMPSIIIIECFYSLSGTTLMYPLTSSPQFMLCECNWLFPCWHTKQTCIRSILWEYFFCMRWKFIQSVNQMLNGIMGSFNTL